MSWQIGKKFFSRSGIDQSQAESILIGSAVLVGVATAISAIIFVWLLENIQHFTGWVLENAGNFGQILLMTLAGLVVGYMINRWASEAKGHGVPEVMEAVAIRGGRIRGRVAAIKVLASSITIGAGGSAGREGPIVQVGSALGSALGRRFNLNEEKIKTLVACGSAAGIAATFNAPIAGALFALEVILGRFTVRNFGAVVVSAVSASVISQTYWGNHPAFTVPAYNLNHVAELPLYIILGFLSALVAVLFIRVLYKAEEFFDQWQIPLMYKTALGMLLTGILALFFQDKQILGPGLHLIGETIANNFSLSLTSMIILLFAKLLATTFTLGTGNSGGVFAPSLFMGAVLGGIVGTVGQQLFPSMVVNPGAYAIVGMAAVFAGAARAPITAILIVFEMSGDYKLILPLMLATVLSTIVAELMFSDSIYSLKLKIKGVNIHRGRDEAVLKSVLVQDVMRPITHPIRETTTIPQLLTIFSRTHLHGLPILDETGGLYGLVTLHDVEEIRQDSLEQQTVAEVATLYDDLVFAYPDDTVDLVLRQLSARELGHMPIVARANPKELLGFIRREDILKAYEIALVKRQAWRKDADGGQLQHQPDMNLIDVIVTAHCRTVGLTVQEIAPLLPEKCVLVSIQRDERVVVPHGDTVLQMDDTLTIYVNKEDMEQTKALFTKKVVEERQPTEQ